MIKNIGWKISERIGVGVFNSRSLRGFSNNRKFCEGYAKKFEPFFWKRLTKKDVKTAFPKKYETYVLDLNILKALADYMYQDSINSIDFIMDYKVPETSDFIKECVSETITYLLPSNKRNIIAILDNLDFIDTEGLIKGDIEIMDFQYLIYCLEQKYPSYD